VKNPSPLVNIGLGQRRLRLIAGVAAGLAALALAVYLLAVGAPRAWRLTVYLPLFVAIGALLEVRAKTCVALAIGGQCSLSPRLNVFEALRGQKIADPALAAALRRRALVLALQIQAITLALTALLFVLPA
jgi:hypothetical protein